MIQKKAVYDLELVQRLGNSRVIFNIVDTKNKCKSSRSSHQGKNLIFQMVNALGSFGLSAISQKSTGLIVMD